MAGRATELRGTEGVVVGQLGRHKGGNGPAALMRHTLEKAGIDCTDREVWWHRDKKLAVAGNDHLALEVAAAV